MTQPDPGRDTRLVQIKDRQVVARRLKEAQLLLMNREAQLVTRADLPMERRLKGAATLMDILESAIVQESDRTWLTDLNVKGELELSDLMEVLTVFAEDKTDEKPVVRRGRPRKTAV
jgi:site-specific recombinase